MKQCSKGIVLALLTLISPKFVQANNEIQQKSDDIGLEIEATLNYDSKQMTYGLIDNADGIITPEVNVKYGFFSFGIAAIFDTTKWGEKEGGYNNRKWKYQEIAFGPSFEYTIETESAFKNIDLSIGYVYEYHPRSCTKGPKNDRTFENPDTQFINFSAGLPDVFLEPAINVEWDIDNVKGALYASLELKHTFELIEDKLDCELSGAIGLGNSKRNGDAFGEERAKTALMDGTLKASLEWKISEQLSFSPYIAFATQLNNSNRDYTDKPNVVYGGVSLTYSF